MTVTSPKFVVNVPNEHIAEKIERSAKQCANMEFREISYPYCGTPLVTVTASINTFLRMNVVRQGASRLDMNAVMW